MPKLGMEPVRRASLVNAAITEVGQAGSMNVTVSQIARRAGVSSALAHHYFGTKEALFLGAMRHILAAYGAEVRRELRHARTPRARVQGIVRAGFASSNFRSEVVGSWLMFYVSAQTLPEARRLLTVYTRRLRSNLVHALRPLVGQRAASVAEILAAQIDGIYLRHGLRPGGPDPVEATACVLEVLTGQLERTQ